MSSPHRNPSLGIFYMCLYAISQAGVWALVRYLSDDMSTETLFFFRNFLGVATVVPLMMRDGLKLFHTKRPGMHLVRAAAAFIGGLSIFYAVGHAPLSTVVAITFSAPVFAAVWAITVGKETFSVARIAAILTGFGGVLIVVNPSASGTSTGIAAALVAAIATAAAFISVKALSSTEKSATLLGLPFLLLLPASLLLASFNWTTPSWTDLIPLVAMGFGFSAAQFFMAKAFAAADASDVLPFDFVRILVASGMGVYFFSEQFDLTTIAGGLVILSAAIFSARASVKDAKANAAR
ncbi:MAG: DMT family transporter [Alphaproteobacteria bacterium]|nr:DMT family transporter [Alphaproteobacteria bacterium]